jgi:predicted permease
VTTNYFHTAGIPILHGRDFSREDTPDAKRVVIVNRTLSTRYFGSSNAVGKRFKMGPQTRPGPFLEIVGVTADTKQAALNAETRPQIYHPVSQGPRGTFSILVRTSGDPMSVAGPIREQLRALDPNQPMTNVRTLEQVVSDSVSRQRFTAVLLTIFAATATLLAIIGLYGVMSYQVTQRTREIGVRMALGAGRGDILWRVVAQGLGAVTAGAVIGLIGSLAAGRLMAGFLFGVTPSDPATLAGVFVLIFAVATAAALIPARRATQVDPTVALRYE